MRVRLQPIGVRPPKDIESAFGAMTKERAEALIPMDDPFVSLQRRRIGDLAAQHRLPTVSSQRVYPEAGALMSYGPSFSDLFRRAATYVDKILKGARPADLPVEQPTVFEMVINLKTAKALGLTIPQSILVRADEIIQ
jgi:putative ABC transport system substrate-binding protein